MKPALIVLRLALRGLLVHKLRSGLSVLGVVFGVSAVTAVASVGEGARREALAQLGELGIDGMTVRARKGGGTELRLRDAHAIGVVTPGLAAMAPVREATLDVAGGGRSLPAGVVGTTPAYARAARLTLAEGRFLADVDVEDAKRVAVLGAAVARTLFPLGGARGQRIAVGGDFYDVVGVAAARGAARGRPGAIRSRDVNRAVFVPLPALDRGEGRTPEGIDEVVLRVADAEQVTAAGEVVRRVVERSTGATGFDVVIPREILRQRERTQRIFNVVTGAIAAISLLVGGIGIMNIMLASVAERTREVGIRRAVGASRRDIALQFLAESTLLTATGGVIGALGGIAGSLAIQHLAGWPTALSPGMLFVGLATALAVGIGFGSYPAWRAAHLEPMEALRRE